MTLIKKALRNSLLVFSLLGLVLFLLYTNVSRSLDQKDKEIVISAGQIALLTETFQKTWNRLPTESEMNAQIENYIKDEVFYKEAVAMGLDKTDQAVKRRLRQLVELMLDNDATVYPTQDQLRTYLSENSGKFLQDPTISFRHVYYPEQGRQEAIDFLSRLGQGQVIEVKDAGRLSMIPSQFEEESRRTIESTFGSEFAADVFELQVGDWQGPVRSAYGWHLVKISHKTEGKIPELEVVRNQVEREWTFDRKQKLMEERYEQIRKKYSISVEEIK